MDIKYKLIEGGINMIANAIGIEDTINEILEEDVLREDERIKKKRRKITEKNYRRKKFNSSPKSYYWPYALGEEVDDKGDVFIKKYDIKNAKPYRKTSDRIVRKIRNGSLFYHGESMIKRVFHL